MSESTMRAMVVVLSAIFEALPPKARRRASMLIEDSAEAVDDVGARRLMATFRAP
jgi:hypothetical protein